MARACRFIREVAGVAALAGLAGGCLEAPPENTGADASAVVADGGGKVDAGTATCSPLVPSGRTYDLGGSYQTFCAVRAGGTVVCWGANDAGEVGADDTEPHPTPTAVLKSGEEQLAGVLRIESGVDFSCALLADGDVFCWGANDFGQLGNADAGGAGGAFSAVDVVASAVDLAAHGSHACAIIAGGQLLCWGRDTDGELGNDDFASTMVPGQVVDEDGLAIDDAVAIDAGRYHTCVVREAGTVACFGWNKSTQTEWDDAEPACRIARATTVRDAGGAPLTGMWTVGAGLHHSCAAGCGRVYCWGNPRCGQLGNGEDPGCTAIDPATCEDEGRSAPVAVVMDDVPDCEVAQVDAGANFSLLRCDDGRVAAWGNGTGGRLGTGSEERESMPVVVPDLVADDIAAGVDSACALRSSDDAVLCWGEGSFGQLGDGSLTAHSVASPQPVMELPP